MNDLSPRKNNVIPEYRENAFAQDKIEPEQYLRTQLKHKFAGKKKINQCYRIWPESSNNSNEENKFPLNRITNNTNTQQEIQRRDLSIMI